MAADGSVVIKIDGDDTGFKDKLNGLGTVAGKAIKGLSAGIAVAGAAVGALGAAVVSAAKASVESYAEYEQLTGGVETLFKESSDAVMAYAENAYKTAGLSSNEYMNTVTSFSASLLQGLSGDTAAAAKTADLAITDMADNANKMGTSMGSIQDAYQGFAKQNYTMLDNLKLGYGGTAGEMARLINDSGVLGDSMTVTAQTVNDVSFDKIIEAIHTVQDNMGITGTTAKEASTTIQGSVASMKAAWSNFLTGMADEGQDFSTLISNVVDSVVIVGQNLIPRIQELLPRLVDGLNQLATDLLPHVAPIFETMLPAIVSGATALAGGLTGVLPQVLTLLVGQSSAIMQAGITVVRTLLSGIQQNLPAVISAAVEVAQMLVSGLLDMLPQLMLMGMEIITQLLVGLVNMLPELIPAAVAAIGTLVDGLIANLPLLLTAAIQLILALALGLIDALPTLIAYIPELIGGICTAIIENLPAIMEAGVTLFLALVENLPAIIEGLCTQVDGIVDSIVAAFDDNWDAIVDAGYDLITGLWQGISDAGAWLWEQVSGFCGDLVGQIKSFFGIASPSKVFAGIGENLALGLGQGWKRSIEDVQKDISASSGALSGKVQMAVDAQVSAAGVQAALGGAGTQSSVINNYNVSSTYNSPNAMSWRDIRLYQDTQTQRLALLGGTL